MEYCLYNKKGIAHITHAIRPTILSTIVIPPYILIFTGYAINTGLLGYEFPGEAWFRRFLSGKLHQAGTVLFPLSENKKLYLNLIIIRLRFVCLIQVGAE